MKRLFSVIFSAILVTWAFGCAPEKLDKAAVSANSTTYACPPPEEVVKLPLKWEGPPVTYKDKNNQKWTFSMSAINKSFTKVTYGSMALNLFGGPAMCNYNTDIRLLEIIGSINAQTSSVPVDESNFVDCGAAQPVQYQDICCGKEGGFGNVTTDKCTFTLD